VWFAHALRWQREPVPWGAVVRGALGAGAVLTAGAAMGHPVAGVPAALGAMLASVNDRTGTRRSAVPRLGVPALAGALGMLIGTALTSPALGAAPFLTLALTAIALLAGAAGAAGPVASAASTQLLITTVIAAGMPLPEPGWQRAALYLAGGGWLLALRLLLPTPRARLDFLGGEREAVAAAYDAVADLLLAAGGPHALARRAALTAALDRAQDALAGGPRAGGPRAGAVQRRLRARYAAVLPLAEAATALTWSGVPAGERPAHGCRRLAAAVRAAAPAGPLPAPTRTHPALRALDDALLQAAGAFADPAPQPRPAAGPNPFRTALRRVCGPAGREYGVRVAVAVGASSAAARALHPQHWYWLPVTAVFLVKPDLGPLASRTVNRAVGTVAGALFFAVVAATAAALPGGAPAWPYVLAIACAALLPAAARHFAAQTAVVTVLVLTFVTAGGDAGAYRDRVTDTLLACAIVAVVGHLPLPLRRGGDISARLTDAAAATERYVGHILDDGDTERRFALRRAAYRTLAGARTAAELAAAELPPLARHSAGAAGEVAALEHLVDTATATAVQLDHPGGGADPAAARTELARLAAARVPAAQVAARAPAA
jgi:uncharacterized membrane protein YccC